MFYQLVYKFSGLRVNIDQHIFLCIVIENVDLVVVERKTDRVAYAYWRIGLNGSRDLLSFHIDVQVRSGTEHFVHRHVL